MTDETKLTMLKHDLQLTTSANDAYLAQLLTLAKSAIEREGIRLIDNVECDMAVVFYAAYLFRKRASQAETSMPRFLRYMLNNILISQKGSVEE